MPCRLNFPIISSSKNISKPAEIKRSGRSSAFSIPLMLFSTHSNPIEAALSSWLISVLYFAVYSFVKLLNCSNNGIRTGQGNNPTTSSASLESLCLSAAKVASAFLSSASIASMRRFEKIFKSNAFNIRAIFREMDFANCFLFSSSPIWENPLDVNTGIVCGYFSTML